VIEVGEKAGAKPDLVHVRVEHQLEVGRSPPHGDEIPERADRNASSAIPSRSFMEIFILFSHFNTC